jgi:serine/threonine-protein kinase
MCGAVEEQPIGAASAQHSGNSTEREGRRRMAIPFVSARSTPGRRRTGGWFVCRPPQRAIGGRLTPAGKKFRPGWWYLYQVSDAADRKPLAPPPTPDRAEIDRWIAEGRYTEAAVALRAQGELAQAQELFERTWDYPSALAVAAERGDLLAQVRLALLGGALDNLHQLQPALAAAPPALQRTIAAHLAAHQQPALAAALYEQSGDLDAARPLYEQAGQLADSARLAERRGDLRAAADAYERVLAAGGPPDPAQQVEAHRGLGRIWQQLGRPEQAIYHLQAARACLEDAGRTAEPAVLDELDVGLLRAFAALGQAQLGHPILLAYAARHPEQPAVQTTADFLAAHPPPAAAAVASDQAAPLVLLGRYQLTRLLGSGGMGRVYLATDRRSDREVALKLLPARGQTAAAPPGSPAELWQRFVREAELLRTLRHPNIVRLLEFHPEAGAQVMEYLPGGSLAHQPLPQPPPVVQRVMLDVLAGLAAAHAAGVLHRDIKPHNLLVSATFDIRLADFGAAHLQGLGATRTESFIGTLAYMAPEQLDGRPLSFATDLYALAVTAFQLVTGRLPFPGPDFISQHRSMPPPDPRLHLPDLPADFAAVLHKALQKSPHDRYASVDEMRHAVAAMALGREPAATARATSPPAAATAGPAAARPASGVTLAGASPILRTAYSTVALGLDLRLGRPVIVEQFHAPEPARFAAHLRWLRALARLGGPGLQRVLRIDEAAAAVHYEAPIGPPAEAGPPLAGPAARLVRRTLARLHDQGLVHGAVAASVVCEPAAALLVLHGRGPLGWSAEQPPTAADDLRQLAELAGPG